jgi:hypothetical protein
MKIAPASLVAVIAAVGLGAASPAAAASLVVDSGLLRSAQETVEEHLSGDQTSTASLPMWTTPQSSLAAAPATTGGIGVGLQVGAPSAITIKFAGAHESGIALGIGAGFGYGRQFGASLWLQADYLIHLATLIDADGLDLAFYGGPGAFVTVFGSNYGFGFAGNPYFNDFNFVGFGLRLPIGLSLAFDSFPLELYGQLDPAVSLFPGIGFGVGASLGFRFYF